MEDLPPPRRGASQLAPFMPALTGIRGLAALWVIAYHYAISPLGALRLFTIAPFVKCGYLGVDLFFLLSGFIITHVHECDAAALTPRSVLHFLTLRLARIYPVHVAMLAALVPIVVVGPHVGFVPHHPEDFRAGDFLYNLLLLQSWGVANDIHWNFPSWSISCEWLAYLIFPVFALLLARIKSARQAVFWLGLEVGGFVIAYIFYFDCSLDLKFDEGGFAHLALARVGFEFVAGALVYRLLETVDLRRWRWGAIVTVALAVAIILGETATRDMAIVMLSGTVIIAGAFSNTAVARLLRAPPLVWLGTISYSLYMVHAPIRMTIGKAAESAIAHTGSPAVAWLVAALMFAVTIALAAILYSWVERPARRWIRRSLADALAADRPPAAASARAVP